MDASAFVGLGAAGAGPAVNVLASIHGSHAAFGEASPRLVPVVQAARAGAAARLIQSKGSKVPRRLASLDARRSLVAGSGRQNNTARAFCGRDDELRLLQEAYRAVALGGPPAPRLVGLVVESGLGKTRVVQEF